MSSSIVKFKATNTTLTFVGSSLNANSSLQGNGTQSETFAQLTEIPFGHETADWT